MHLSLMIFVPRKARIITQVSEMIHVITMATYIIDASSLSAKITIQYNKITKLQNYDLRSTDTSLNTFKNKLKTFLFDADAH